MSDKITNYLQLKAQINELHTALTSRSFYIYGLFAVQKDKVSNTSRKWTTRDCRHKVKFTSNHIVMLVKYDATRFANNGMCYSKVVKHTLKFPSSWLEIDSDDELNEKIVAYLAAEKASKELIDG